MQESYNYFVTDSLNHYIREIFGNNGSNGNYLNASFNKRMY